MSKRADRSVFVAPSDFVYLLSDCRRCWWLKAVARIKRPTEGMPEIFNKIDGQFKTALSQEGALESVGIRGRLVAADQWIKSRPVVYEDLGVELQVIGKLDQLIRLGEDTEGFELTSPETEDPSEYEVTDEKTTVPSEKKRGLFEHQLNAYAYGLMNPLRGKPKKVVSLSLMVFGPEQMHVIPPTESTPCSSVMTGSLTRLEVPLNQGQFEAQLRAIAELAALPKPPPAPEWCPFCGYTRSIFAFAQSMREEQRIKDASNQEETVTAG
jgi:hypothetical protein